MEPLPLVALAFAGFLTGIYACSRTLASMPNFTFENFKIGRLFGYVAAISLLAPLFGWIAGNFTSNGLEWSLLITAIFAWLWVISVLYDARNA